MFGINKKKKNVGTLVAQEREYILNENSDFYVREAYNALRSNVTFSLTGNECKVIAVTSTNQHEGKSINALNLAIEFADINKKVLLVDFDLRKPKVHRLLATRSTPGVSNFLIGEYDMASAIRRMDAYNIDVMTSGDIPPNSTILLESERLEEFFAYVKAHYDYVILDTPPVNVVIDACIIAKYVSGVVFVIRQGATKKEHVTEAVRQLEFSQGKVLGFVLNDIVDKDLLGLRYTYRYQKYKYGKYGKYYKHGYGYGYQSREEKGERSASDTPKKTESGSKTENVPAKKPTAGNTIRESENITPKSITPSAELLKKPIRAPRNSAGEEGSGSK